MNDLLYVFGGGTTTPSPHIHLIMPITNIFRFEFHLRSVLRYGQQRSVTCVYLRKLTNYVIQRIITLWHCPSSRWPLQTAWHGCINILHTYTFKDSNKCVNINFRTLTYRQRSMLVASVVSSVATHRPVFVYLFNILHRIPVSNVITVPNYKSYGPATFALWFIIISEVVWLVGFIPVAPTSSIGHQWNASFHFSFLI
jgi:hypothetical protein